VWVCVVYCTEAGSASLSTPSSDRTALRKVIDFVRETTDDNLRDMNRKLQHILEETLTKNMHLQKVTSMHLITRQLVCVFLLIC